MTNAIRLICGTFNWKCSEKPTSLDIVVNQSRATASPTFKRTHCQCSLGSLFFSVASETSCPSCNGISPFVPTATRISTAAVSPTIVSKTSPEGKASFSYNIDQPTSTSRHQKRDNPHPHHNQASSGILRDISNIPPNRPPQCPAARPNSVELNAIAQKNYMLSNFVVSYFFKILQVHFPTILYQEFLFDFVKREGGWQQFVEFSHQEGHSITFLEQLRNCQFTCVVPICKDLHWTILVRKYINSSWVIYYIDSMLQGSDARMHQWRELFNDNDLFSGTWIKLKIIPQTELECGARVCLHGLCFSISSKNAKDIGRQLQRIPDLAARSRLLVSGVCGCGNWTPQGWLKSIIGLPQPVTSEPHQALQL